MPLSTNGTNRLSAVAATSLGRQPPGDAPFRAGQLYRATVESKEADGGYMLRVGNQLLRLPPGPTLLAGQELLIRMTAASGQPKFTVMRILPPPRDPAANVVNEAVLSALQGMATRQQPLSGLLAWLQAGGRAAPEASSLLALFSSPDELVQPERLQGAIRDSGLLLEARLAAAAWNPAMIAGALEKDFKLLLWRLLSQGGGLADGLEEMLDGLLSHISLRQLRAIRHAEDGHFYWSLDVPLAWGDRLLPISITLRQEGGLVADADEEASWEVEFSLDAEPLGALQVRLFLKQQQLSVSLEAERPATVDALQSEIETLWDTLGLQGFSVETVVARPAQREARSNSAGEFSAVSALGTRL
ncbi:MAG: flagellar hook-length control protein FliK [Halieaceae bacterium]|nr:flagellar hook-length control protein FliK [Halieaceae bacterium]